MSVLRSLKLKKLELLTQAKEAATSPRLKPDFASPALNLSSTVFSENEIEPVSYTHLTLPTIYSV